MSKRVKLTLNLAKLFCDIRFLGFTLCHDEVKISVNLAKLILT